MIKRLVLLPGYMSASPGDAARKQRKRDVAKERYLIFPCIADCVLHTRQAAQGCASLCVFCSPPDASDLMTDAMRQYYRTRLAARLAVLCRWVYRACVGTSEVQKALAHTHTHTHPQAR